MTTTFRRARLINTRFKPHHLTKVKAWYSMDYMASLGTADDVVMPTVYDVSGHGNHISLTGGPTGPKFRAAGGQLGGPSWQFPGGSVGHYVLPNIFGSSGSPSYNLPNNAAELYATKISEHDGTDPYPGTWSFGMVSGDPVHYPFSPSGASYVYEKFGLPAGNRPNGTAPISLTSWHRVNMWTALVAAGGWGIQWNDVAATGWQIYTGHGQVKMDSAPLLGINQSGGAASSLSNGNSYSRGR